MDFSLATSGTIRLARGRKPHILYFPRDALPNLADMPKPKSPSAQAACEKLRLKDDAFSIVATSSQCSFAKMELDGLYEANCSGDRLHEGACSV